MTIRKSTLLYLCLLQVYHVYAIRFPVVGRRGTRPANHQLDRRQDGKTIGVDDENNVEYTANITMGGQQFEVTIDTGSSDLWVQRNVPNAQDTPFQSSVQYVVGAVQGPVKLVETIFSGFTVKSQAFIAVAPGSASNTVSNDGLIGLGPSSGSNIFNDMNESPQGRPFLDNVFIQDTSSPNIITVMLSRDGDTGKQVRGEFSIGEVVSDLSAINNQPKLPVKVLPLSLSGNQHWSSLVDGIKGPDGKSISLTSRVSGVNKGQMVAVYDSGFTFPQIPSEVSTAIYTQIPGAKFSNSDGAWLVPCNQEVNLTFVIGGQNYPIHPFDVAFDTGSGGSTNGMCVGAFQPISDAEDPTFDMVLGMAFLRNAYMLINFGDFVDGNPEKQGDPFMQLLSVTDPADAHQDFVQQRLGGVDSTGSQTRLPGQSAPTSTNTGDNNDFTNAKSFIERNWPYLAAAGGVLALIIVGLCVWSSVRSKSRRKTYTTHGIPTSGPYQPLNDPAPAPAVELHQNPGGYANNYYNSSGYTDYYHPSGGYSDPYYRN